jgi:hypothetical protein
MVRYSFERNGKVIHYAITEITKRDWKENGHFLIPPDEYFEVVIKRFDKNAWIQDVVKRFECPLYIIVFQDDCDYIWVIDYAKRRYFRHNSVDEHIKWLDGLYYKAMGIPIPPIDEDEW